MLARPLEDRAGAEGSRIALDRTRAGRYLRVIYVPDPEPSTAFVVTAYPLAPKPLNLAPKAEETSMKRPRFPPGWDEARVRRVLEHYESQTDDEAVAEDEAAFEAPAETTMQVPVDLVPAVRKLIARRDTKSRR